MKLRLIKSLKIFMILLCLLMTISNLYVAVEAYDVSTRFKGDSSIDVAPVKTILSTVLDVVRLVGTGVALGILIWIGAKIMMAAPSERANIKQYAINYVVGAFILIGASAILTIIKNFATSAITA